MLRQRWSNPLIPNRRWTVLPTTIGSLSASETVTIELMNEEPSDVSIPSPDEMPYTDDHTHDAGAGDPSGDGYESDDVVFVGESRNDDQTPARAVQPIELPDCAWTAVSFLPAFDIGILWLIGLFIISCAGTAVAPLKGFHGRRRFLGKGGSSLWSRWHGGGPRSTVSRHRSSLPRTSRFSQI